MMVGEHVEQSRPNSAYSLRLALWLFPFVWGAVAINLFLLGLLLGWLSWWPWDAEVVSPYLAMGLALPLAFPANWACVRWVQNLLREAGD